MGVIVVVYYYMCVCAYVCTHVSVIVAVHEYVCAYVNEIVVMHAYVCMRACV